MQFNFMAEQTCTTVYWKSKGKLDLKVSTFAVRNFLLLSKASASSSCVLLCAVLISYAVQQWFTVHRCQRYPGSVFVLLLVSCHTVTLWVDGPLITDSKRQLSQFFCLLHL